MWMQMSRKEKERKRTYFVNADGGHVGLRPCCMQMQMSRKERRKKKRKNLLQCGWLASGLVFQSLVQSGFFAFFGATGP